MPKYEYKSPPLKHQREYLLKHATDIFWMLRWKMGVGKTKTQIDNFCYLYEQRTVDTLFVVAPNGVQRAWVTDEFPKHMPDRILSRLKVLIWEPTKLKTKKYQQKIKEWLEWDGPRYIGVNYESTITKGFEAFTQKWWRRSFKVYICLDESHRIKSTDSFVKKRLTAISDHCTIRREMSGTPLEKPEDIYTQVRFLDPGFWPRHGLHTPTEFRNRFCVFAERSVPDRRQGAVRGARMLIKQVVGSKNQDELNHLLGMVSDRMTMKDAGIELPPLTYSKKYFEMSPEQARVYRELKQKYETILQSGDKLKAPTAIVRMLRHQQITCGYVACEREQPEQEIEPGKNRRLELLLDDILPQIDHQGIIWSRFIHDIDLITQALGKKCVRYDGMVGQDEREHNKKRFQSGDVQWFVGNQEAGGTGLNLQAANTMIYYANNFRYITRDQSESRMHRNGQFNACHIIDICCEHSIDGYIIDKLRDKKIDVDRINGDEEIQWI